MLFRQYVDEDLGCSSYLIGDEQAGEAVVVDPAYAVEPYLEEAERRGVRILRVLETHTHADHVSGHGRLALEHGIPVSIHPAAEPAFPFDPLADGAEVAAGEATLRVLHTPGHRPEHCCFAVSDRSRGDEPWLVLTGDSLFVGDAGRPDLAVAAVDGARGLFHSLRRLLELADGVEVYPGHVAGSLCGAGMSSKPSSTIGFERRYNHALSFTHEEDFVTESAAVASPQPPNAEHIVALNRGPFLGRAPELEPVELRDGATVLDVRPVQDFVAGHVPGALNVPVSGSAFATKAGFVLSLEERVIVQASSPEEARRAARGLRAVGFLELEGYVLETPASAHLQPVDLDELERLLAAREVELLDVRELGERDRGYIAGSRHVPYRVLRACARDLDPDRPVVTMCETGARAGIAASILAAAGVEARPLLGSGVGDWERRGNRTIQFRRCGT